jgi:hypothetical protein
MRKLSFVPRGLSFETREEAKTETDLDLGLD